MSGDGPNDHSTEVASHRDIAGTTGMTERPSVSPEVSASPSDSDRSISWAIGLTILIESLYVLWTASRGFFYQDDFVDFAEARRLGFDGRLLEQPVFGHFIPGYNLVNYVFSSFTPYHWPIVEVADVLIFATSLALLYVVMKLLFGLRWQIVPLIALAGASFSMVPSIDWFASGLQLVSITATLLLLICHIRFVTTGLVRFAILGAVSLAIALAFYDGALVSVVFIVLMTVLIWPVAPGISGTAGSLFEYWQAWICYGAVVALDLGWRFTHSILFDSPPAHAKSGLRVHIALMDANVRSSRLSLRSMVVKRPQ